MNNKCPAVAVDVICYHIPTGNIVLIERKFPPLGLAIPGGFVDEGETVEQAAKREMKEELGVELLSLQFIGYFDDPKRDPRRHVISFAFFATIGDEPVAGDDAKSIKMVNPQELFQDWKTNKSTRLVFDHEKILLEAFEEGFLRE